MMKTTLKNIASIMSTNTPNPISITGAAVDSRLVKPGDLFFALPGNQTDGHQFLQAAALNGASAAVVHLDYRGQDFGLPLLHVSDVLAALQLLAKTIIKSSKAKIVAVTGSVGKTTTKGFITSLLQHKFKVTSSPGNSNSQIGLPLAILNHVTLDEEIIVLEMGMTEKGQITKLIDIAPPHIAVVTMVALVHAAYFDSIADIACAKGEIMTHPRTELGIYHRESDINRALSTSGSCEKKSFSTTSTDSDYYLYSDGKKIKIDGFGKSPVVLPLLDVPGAHNYHNFLAAVAVAKHLGMSQEEISQAQKKLELPERRLQFVNKHGAIFINDAYNACELSVKAALDTLPVPLHGGKKIAVLGGIVELGKFSVDSHRAIGEYALDCVDDMYCFGDDCKPILDSWKKANRPVIWTQERSEIIAALREKLQPNDVILLKGSRAKGVWKVLEEI